MMGTKMWHCLLFRCGLNTALIVVASAFCSQLPRTSVQTDGPLMYTSGMIHTGTRLRSVSSLSSRHNVKYRHVTQLSLDSRFTHCLHLRGAGQQDLSALQARVSTMDMRDTGARTASDPARHCVILVGAPQFKQNFLGMRLAQKLGASYHPLSEQSDLSTFQRVCLNTTSSGTEDVHGQGPHIASVLSCNAELIGTEEFKTALLEARELGCMVIHVDDTQSSSSSASSSNQCRDGRAEPSSAPSSPSTEARWESARTHLFVLSSSPPAAYAAPLSSLGASKNQEQEEEGQATEVDLVQERDALRLSALVARERGAGWKFGLGTFVTTLAVRDAAEMREAVVHLEGGADAVEWRVDYLRCFAEKEEEEEEEGLEEVKEKKEEEGSATNAEEEEEGKEEKRRRRRARIIAEVQQSFTALKNNGCNVPGGGFSGSEDEVEILLTLAIDLGVDAVEIEMVWSPTMADAVMSRKRLCRVLTSYYDTDPRFYAAGEVGMSLRLMGSAFDFQNDLVKFVVTSPPLEDGGEAQAGELQQALQQYNGLLYQDPRMPPAIALCDGPSGEESRLFTPLLAPGGSEEPGSGPSGAISRLFAARVKQGIIAPKRFLVAGARAPTSVRTSALNAAFRSSGLQHLYEAAPDDAPIEVLQRVLDGEAAGIVFGDDAKIPAYEEAHAKRWELSDAAASIGAVTDISVLRARNGTPHAVCHNSDWLAIQYVLRRALGASRSAHVISHVIIAGHGPLVRAALYALVTGADTWACRRVTLYAPSAEETASIAADFPFVSVASSMAALDLGDLGDCRGDTVDSGGDNVLIINAIPDADSQGRSAAQRPGPKLQAEEGADGNLNLQEATRAREEGGSASEEGLERLLDHVRAALAEGEQLQVQGPGESRPGNLKGGRRVTVVDLPTLELPATVAAQVPAQSNTANATAKNGDDSMG